MKSHISEKSTFLMPAMTKELAKTLFHYTQDIFHVSSKYDRPENFFFINYP